MLVECSVTVSLCVFHWVVALFSRSVVFLSLCDPSFQATRESLARAKDREQFQAALSMMKQQEMANQRALKGYQDSMVELQDEVTRLRQLEEAARTDPTLEEKGGCKSCAKLKVQPVLLDDEPSLL